jgi:hypothetical protein
MGIATFPAASSGGLSSVIKSLQRGTAASAGNITISTVDITKTVVRSFSTGSAGSVAATGTLSAANGTTSGMSTSAANASGAISGYLTPGLAYSQYGSFGGNPIPTSYGTGYTFNQYIPRYGVYNSNFNPQGMSMLANMNSALTLNAMNTNGMNVGLNATNLSGGTTSLTAATYGAYLVNSTTIYATGACQYEVVEYN